MAKDHTVHSTNISPIALVHSPYKEKFGIPRQPGLIPAATGFLKMLPPYNDVAAFSGIEGFSHLWITFGFHACAGKSHLRVRPPRLGGNQEVGVFASRSPFRPNNLGLSVVRFLHLDAANDALHIHVNGLDLLDGTPVYDIKPYIPYADSIPDALGGFATESPKTRLKVVFSDTASSALAEYPKLQSLIEQTIGLDPRPAYQQKLSSDRVYGMRLANFDVRWRVDGDLALIEELVAIT